MNRRIVIIGGMGPQASIELHQRIITGAAKAGAKDNEDYPEILHASIPIPDFISSPDDSKGLRRLLQSLDSLLLRHDDILIVACNTVHLVVPEIEDRYNVEVTSLVLETVENVRKTGMKKIGVLASPTTIKKGLYEKPLLQIGCNVMLPSHADIEILEQAVRHVIANTPASQFKGLLEPVVKRMLRDGAEQVVLGCTELSIIFGDSLNKKIVDPLRIISHKALELITE